MNAIRILSKVCLICVAFQVCYVPLPANDLCFTIYFTQPDILELVISIPTNGKGANRHCTRQCTVCSPISPPIKLVISIHCWLLLCVWCVDDIWRRSVLRFLNLNRIWDNLNKFSLLLPSKVTFMTRELRVNIISVMDTKLFLFMRKILRTLCKNRGSLRWGNNNFT